MYLTFSDGIKNRAQGFDHRMSSVNQHSAACSHFTHQPLASNASFFQAQSSSATCLCTVCRPSVTCQVRQGATNTLPRLRLTSRGVGHPLRAAANLSGGTFDDHLTDLTIITDAVCGQREDVQIRFHCKNVLTVLRRLCDIQNVAFVHSVIK